MGSEWKEFLFEDAPLQILDGDRGKNYPKRAEFTQNGYCIFLNTGNVTSLGFNFASVDCVSKERDELLRKGKLVRQDVILTTRGTVGNVAYFNGNVPYEHIRINSGMVILRSDRTSLSPQFLYLFLRSLLFKGQVEALTTGSAQPQLPIRDIKKVKITLPPLPEQKAIAHVLGALDDRIELNRRMNETLEAMAQALFKSWFVDFDPVIDNALASGKEIPAELSDRAAARVALGDKRQSLPAEIRTLFPDEFVYSDEMGWIPEGWGVRSINKILKTVSETYPLKNVDKVVFLNTGDILDGQFLHHNYSEPTGLPGQAKKSIKKDDILYSEIRPKNRRFAYVYFDAPEHVVSTKLMVLRAISDIKSIFAYFILKQEASIDYLQMMAESRSGTFPQITFDVLSTINVALPDKYAIIEYFTTNVLERTFQKSIKNDSNSTTLSKLRDTLLPKLLSGEVRISEAEKMVETSV